MIKITEVVMVWFGGDLIFKTYIYVFCELGPVKKTRTYTYVVAKGLRKQSVWGSLPLATARTSPGAPCGPRFFQTVLFSASKHPINMFCTLGFVLKG